MLQIKEIRKQYKTGDFIQNALDGVSLELRDNEFVAILGPSGSGKTTLLNIIGGLDRYDSGDLIINGISTKEYKDRDWDAYRNHTIGFVFQSYNLIPHQTVLSNVELALTLSGISRSERKRCAKQALEKVGLGQHLNKKPNQMSGGQMQRVAIARALVNNPEIILADEPTGALDSETSIQVMELLKEVAKDHLVVMVTHNPELAEEYATRIVRLKDGQIISDSNPVESHEIETTTEKTKRTRLRFSTALGLSLNNLMTKKGRTFLTSFAGAIGIIGIALILALSSGVNAYISSLESDMMGSYPIELEKQTFDMSSMMAQGGPGEKKEEHDLDAIYSNNIVTDTVQATESMMKENNLGKFKTYLESETDCLSGKIAAIEYGYDITPQVFRMNEEEVLQVSPATLETGSSVGGMTIGGSTSSAWSQLVNHETLREKQYELLSGEWPSAYDEAALIITKDNEVSDYTLYTLGIMDIDRMNELVEAVENGEEYDDPQEKFSYSDVIHREYKVFAPCELYAKSDDGVWIDKSENEEYLSEIYENGVTVKITCVLRATDEAEISSGVGYDGRLTEYLMELTENSEIVKEQLADSKTNILTGESFEEDEEESDTDENTISQSNSTQISSDRTGAKVIPAQTTRVATSNKKYSLSFMNTTGESTTTETPDTDDGETKATFKVKFANYDGSILIPETTYTLGDEIINLPTEDPTRTETSTVKYYFIGWQSSVNNAYYRTADLPTVTEDVTYTAMFYEYTLPADESDTGATTPDMGGSGTATPDFGGDGTNVPTTGGTTMPDVGDFDMSAITGPGTITGSMSTNLTDDQLSVMMAQMSDSTPSTYEDVLTALGYCTVDEPTTIAIYPTDFEAKESIEALIENYNAQVESDADHVTYTDIIGTLTSSITSIVDTVSYVLIAFVAISLVVSSIMIAIITYISVLERTKEIGVLRALGASKNDVSKIFNAETFIEGLISGLLGIGTTWLLCIPINAIVLALVGVDGIATLPMQYSIALIAVSVLLTTIAGYAPSRMAAKKDPVKALRTE